MLKKIKLYGDYDVYNFRFDNEIFSIFFIWVLICKVCEENENIFFMNYWLWRMKSVDWKLKIRLNID